MIQELQSKQKEILLLLDQAAKELLHYWPGAQSGAKGDLKIEQKADKTLVSQADYAANDILVAGLQELFPHILIVSEESESENIPTGNYFLIDPLDGTSRFLDGADDFATLVAYIDGQGVAVAGWMQFPARSQVLWAIGDTYGVEGDAPATLRLFSGEELRSGHSYLRWGGREQELASSFSELIEEPLHSGEAFFRFLEGDLDALILKLGRLGPWDVAAPAAIIRALGGAVCCGSGSEFLFPYQAGENFVATTKALKKATFELVSRLDGLEDGKALS